MIRVIVIWNACRMARSKIAMCVLADREGDGGQLLMNQTEFDHTGGGVLAHGDISSNDKKGEIKAQGKNIQSLSSLILSLQIVPSIEGIGSCFWCGRNERAER